MLPDNECKIMLIEVPLLIFFKKKSSLIFFNLSFFCGAILLEVKKNISDSGYFTFGLIISSLLNLRSVLMGASAST